MRTVYVFCLCWVLWRCLHVEDFFPAEFPVWCSSYSRQTPEWTLTCCNDTDYCNLKLIPPIITTTTSTLTTTTTFHISLLPGKMGPAPPPFWHPYFLYIVACCNFNSIFMWCSLTVCVWTWGAVEKTNLILLTECSFLCYFVWFYLNIGI